MTTVYVLTTVCVPTGIVTEPPALVVQSAPDANCAGCLRSNRSMHVAEVIPDLGALSITFWENSVDRSSVHLRKLYAVITLFVFRLEARVVEEIGR